MIFIFLRYNNNYNIGLEYIFLKNKKKKKNNIIYYFHFCFNKIYTYNVDFSINIWLPFKKIISINIIYQLLKKYFGNKH